MPLVFQKYHCFWLVLIVVIQAGVLQGQIKFEEVAILKNVTHAIEKGSIGAGVSVYDFNRDGLDDLTLGTEKGRSPGFYINTGSDFEKIPPLVDNLEEVKQILWADYDNDGDADLFIAGYQGMNHLYRNDGALSMKEITASSGLPLERREAYGACWGDYNRDGWLDLLCNFRTLPGQQRGGNKLFKNNADGTFTEVTEQAKMENEDKMPFASVFLDYNNDKWPDIYTANDKLTFNTLYENTGSGDYLDVSELTLANARMNAMCVNARDVNNDGWTDIYITNTPIGSQCLLNSGPNESIFDITFSNVAANLGITYAGGTGWGSTFFDADNDGDLDLYVCGNGIDPSIKGIHFYENINLQHFEIRKEDFEKDTFASFSNAIADFNQDGRLDIIVQNNPPARFFLWENNTSNNNNWVKIQLEGVLSNRDAIGTRIESYAGDLFQSTYTHCGFGFLGQNSAYQHIGLEEKTLLDSLVLFWPSGHIDRYYGMEPNQIYYLKEGNSTNGAIYVDEDVRIIERSEITSLENQQSDQIAAKIWPNPAANILSIQAEISLSEISIYTQDGRLIERLSFSTGKKRINHNIQSYPKGVYLIKLKRRDNLSGCLKWIKI